MCQLDQCTRPDKSKEETSLAAQPYDIKLTACRLRVKTTHRLLIGKQHVYQEGHANSVNCGHNDVRVASFWGDDHFLGIFHPIDPLNLKHFE